MIFDILEALPELILIILYFYWPFILITLIVLRILQIILRKNFGPVNHTKRMKKDDDGRWFRYQQRLFMQQTEQQRIVDEQNRLMDQSIQMQHDMFNNNMPGMF